jgi:hypothetical protein
MHAIVYAPQIPDSRFQCACVLMPSHCNVSQEHGTCSHPAKPDAELRWGVPHTLADKISCFTRRYAEHSGYWESTSFLESVRGRTDPVTFRDSVTGAPLFVAPQGRSWAEFVKESRAHGWPSFRDSEVSLAVYRALHSNACAICRVVPPRDRSLQHFVHGHCDSGGDCEPTMSRAGRALSHITHIALLALTADVDRPRLCEHSSST